MDDHELDQLLDGAAGIVLKHHQSGRLVHFSRHELASPVAFRSRMRRYLQPGVEPAHLDQDEHDEFVRDLIRGADQDNA